MCLLDIEDNFGLLLSEQECLQGEMDHTCIKVNIQTSFKDVAHFLLIAV